MMNRQYINTNLAIIAIMRAHRHKRANHNILEAARSPSHSQSSSHQQEFPNDGRNNNLGQSHQVFLKIQDLNNQHPQENEENRVKQNQIYVGKRFMQRKPTYQNMQNFTANLVVNKKSGTKRIKKPLFDSEESDGAKQNNEIAQQSRKNQEDIEDCLYIPAEKQQRNMQISSEVVARPEQQQKSVQKQGEQENEHKAEENREIKNIFEFQQKQEEIQKQKQTEQEAKEPKQSKCYIDIDVNDEENKENNGSSLNEVKDHSNQNQIEMSEIKLKFKAKKNVKINQHKNTQKNIGEEINKQLNSSKQISICLMENIRGAKKLLYEPIGLNDRLIFAFKRVKHMFSEVFELYMEGNKHPMLYCSNKKNSIGANYYISLTEQMNKNSQAFMGKIRGNLLGSEYSIYDSGIIPSNCSDRKDWRITLGQIKYQPNFMGLDGPRRLQVCIPKAKSIEQLQSFKYTQKQQKSLCHCSPVLKLQNKQPRWIKSYNSFGLNMGPRVKSPSIKNFILVRSNTYEQQVQEQNLLTFGKVKQDTFSMEMRYPLSILQAFAICVTQFDRKINCQ